MQWGLPLAAGDIPMGDKVISSNVLVSHQIVRFTAYSTQPPFPPHKRRSPFPPTVPTVTDVAWKNILFPRLRFLVTVYSIGYYFRKKKVNCNIVEQESNYIMLPYTSPSRAVPSPIPLPTMYVTDRNAISILKGGLVTPRDSGASAN